MKPTRQPLFFVIVKIVLLLNIVSGGFLLLMLFGGITIDSFSSSFEKSEIVLDVRRAVSDTTAIATGETPGYAFKQSKTGDLTVNMPWYTHFFVPFGFLNIPGFELSIPYLIFYSLLCFLFYRIVAATEIESPFSDKNIKRIFWIGYILILYDVFIILRSGILTYYVENITDKAFRYDGLGPLVYFKVGILVIILAMIYRRGVAMQREQELTV